MLTTVIVVSHPAAVALEDANAKNIFYVCRETLVVVAPANNIWPTGSQRREVRVNLDGLHQYARIRVPLSEGVLRTPAPPTGMVLILFRSYACCGNFLTSEGDNDRYEASARKVITTKPVPLIIC